MKHNVDEDKQIKQARDLIANETEFLKWFSVDEIGLDFEKNDENANPAIEIR